MEAQTNRRIEKTVRAGTIAGIGLVAGALGGVAMAMWQMAVGAIAATPTAVPGIESSAWTSLTSITSVFFGLDAFGSWFSLLPVAFGAAVHMTVSATFGAVGVGLIVALLGNPPGPFAAAVQGVVFGLFLQVALVNLTVNPIQDVNTVYTSTPEWSWWLAHAIFGMTVGLAAGGLLSRSRAARVLSRAGP